MEDSVCEFHLWKYKYIYLKLLLSYLQYEHDEYSYITHVMVIEINDSMNRLLPKLSLSGFVQWEVFLWFDL